MNREIKFRAWDEDRKVMVLDFSKEITYEIIFSSDDENMFCGNFMDNGDWQEPKLMQYTGLKDKNGVEIYEGDICNRYHLKGVVVYHNGMFILQDGFNEPLMNELYGIEVIGNIYENPELLNK